MGVVTLTQLRARVRELADMGATTFVTDAATSLDSFINIGLQKLYDLICTTDSDTFPSSTTDTGTVAIASGTGTIVLPLDMSEFLGLDINFGGSTIDVSRFTWKQRNQLRAQGAYAWGQDTPRYAMQGGNLILNGRDGTYSYVLWYTPGATLLSSGSDSVSYPNGYEHYAVLYAAILCAQKEETDPSTLMALLAEERSRIEDSVRKRDSANPPQMVDVETLNTDSNGPW